jgi:hypothetical protein
MILRQVDQWCAAGASPSKAEVIEGLEALVDKELAGAYRLSASGSPEIVHEFRSAGVADDLYFLLTAKGKAALSCEATPDSPS